MCMAVGLALYTCIWMPAELPWYIHVAQLVEHLPRMQFQGQLVCFFLLVFIFALLCLSRVPLQ